MGDRIVAYKASPKSEDAGSVAARLRAIGVEIVDEQPQMLLLSGAADAINRIINGVDGWKVTAETKTAPPNTRERALKPPSE